LNSYIPKALDSLEDMNTFPEVYNLTRWNLKQTENLNRPIMGKEIESVIKTPIRRTEDLVNHVYKN
jgi:hypothetical protein